MTETTANSQQPIANGLPTPSEKPEKPKPQFSKKNLHHINKFTNFEARYFATIYGISLKFKQLIHK